ncbi:MAG TPA: hypothetical protein PJ988_04905 [Anaerolinea sp.]|nr:hypothetical protein [Anaerolinea sp.]
MAQLIAEPRVVRLSVGVYRWMLSAYPSAFRRQYGEAMAQVFGDCCRSAFGRAGAGGLPGLWARTMLDYLSSVIEEHANRGADMSRGPFTNWSGWALLSGSLMIFLGWLAGTRPTYNPYNAASLPIDRFLNVGDTILLALGLTMTAVGLIGLLARFGARTDMFGRASLALGGVSGLVSAAGAIGSTVVDTELWWTMFFLGMAFMLLGVGLFGIGCAQRRLLDGWSSLPLATALWMPLAVVAELVYQSVKGPSANLPPAFSLTIVVGLAGLALLGVAALRASPAERLLAAGG